MPGKLKNTPSRKILQYLYCELGLSQSEVGQRLGMSQDRVRHYLNLYDIPTRPRGVCGTGNPKSRLNEEQVREIKRQLMLGAKLKPLSDQFAVSMSTIESIAIGRTWKHVPNPYPERIPSHN